MELMIHAGLNKAGSSYLQGVLLANKVALHKQGIPLLRYGASQIAQTSIFSGIRRRRYNGRSRWRKTMRNILPMVMKPQPYKLPPGSYLGKYHTDNVDFYKKLRSCSKEYICKKYLDLEDNTTNGDC